MTEEQSQSGGLKPDGQNALPAINSDGLISLVYDTAFDPLLWPSLLEVIGNAVGQEMFSSSPTNKEPDSLNSPQLKWLTPHFERAMHVGGKIYQIQAEHHILRDFLNQFPVGVAIVQSNGDVVALNSNAETLINKSSILSLKDNALDFPRHPVLATKLRRAIRMVAAGVPTEENKASYNALRVTDAEQSLSLLVTPIRDIAENMQQDFAAILIAGVDAGSRVNASELCKSHGLTDAETRLVDVLLGGCNSLPEAAEELGVSAHTVRSQMKSVFGKMYVSSQVELLKKIFTSPEVLLKAEDTKSRLPPQGKNGIHQRPSHLIKLSDGRYLEYLEFGDPSGVPLIFLHGAIHTRKLFHPFSRYIDDHNIRVIAPKRPGFGKSEMPRKSSLKSYAADIEQLLDYLDLDNVYLIGADDGGPFALACAAVQGSRINRMALIATLAPPKFEKIEKMVSLDRLMHGLNKVAPVFATHLMRVAIRGLKKNPFQYIEKIYNEMPPSDQAVVDMPEYADMWCEMLDDITADNLDAFIENYLARLVPWDFGIDEVRVPTDIWHGEEDRRTPVAFARKLQEAIPDSRALILAEQGHYLFFTHWDQILENLVRPRV